MLQTILAGLKQDLSEPTDYTALWVILGIFAVIAAVVIGVLLYRNWRSKNCCPIYFAGRVRYARKGETIQSACCDLYDRGFITECISSISSHMYNVSGLYINSTLTTPLDTNAIVTAPVYIFPKIEQ